LDATLDFIDILSCSGLTLAGCEIPAGVKSVPVKFLYSAFKANKTFTESAISA